MWTDLPNWAQRAAERLYADMERIDGEAMNDGQVDQNTKSERFTWMRLVAEIIAEEYRKGEAR